MHRLLDESGNPVNISDKEMARALKEFSPIGAQLPIDDHVVFQVSDGALSVVVNGTTHWAPADLSSEIDTSLDTLRRKVEEMYAVLKDREEAIAILRTRLQRNGHKSMQLSLIKSILEMDQDDY